MVEKKRGGRQVKNMLLNIRVLPRSSRNEIVGEMVGGALKVKLTAAPVDGKANEALIELLSEHFNVPKNKIAIRKGLRGKNKVVDVDAVIASRAYRQAGSEATWQSPDNTKD